MQMSSQKNHNKGFCLLGGTFLWYFEVEFSVLEWDGMFCSTDMSFLNQLLVIALKRQHKNNSCTSIILPLCRLREELNFSPFPANIASAFNIHFLASISLPGNPLPRFKASHARAVMGCECCPAADGSHTLQAPKCWGTTQFLTPGHVLALLKQPGVLSCL